MTTNNPDRAARLAAGLNRAFGETFTIIPRAAQSDRDLPRVADATRTEFTATGVWASGAKVARLHARGHADSNAQPAIAAGPCVSFAEADLPWLPPEGDLCRRELDGSTYAVAKTLPDGFGRVKITLTAKKR